MDIPNYGLIQLVIVLCSIGLGVFAGGWFVGLRIQQKIKTGALIRVEDYDNTVRQIVSTLKFGHNVNEVQKDYSKLFSVDAQAQLAADLDASEKAENGPITFRPEPVVEIKRPLKLYFPKSWIEGDRPINRPPNE